MYHRLRREALNLINKTPLEPAIRHIYGIIVPSKGNQYDKQTFNLMRQILNNDSNCIDVGAYRGEILAQIKKVSPNGQHFAFEPVPNNYEYLVNKFPDIKVHNIALSSKKGSATFQHVVGRPARSGLKKVEYPDSHQEVKEIKVKVDTLDNLIPKKSSIDFLKIDVEGAELGVLKGAKKLIAKHKPIIVFEHELEKSLHYDTQPEHIYDLLVKDLGMHIHLMEDYLQGKKPLSRSKFIKVVKDNTDFYFMATAGKA